MLVTPSFRSGSQCIEEVIALDVCNFLRMMETFHFSLDLLYFRVMDMLSIVFPIVRVHVCCISGCVLYVLSAACGNYQITWSHIMKKKKI